MTRNNELTPSQAAARLGASTRSVQRWIREGRLPARRVGGRWRVSTDVLGAFGVSRPSEAAETHRFRILYIANRGEIERRIRRTCDRLGIRVVAPGRDDAPEVDLLDGPAVIRAARAAGSDALHPGFGFLSERADFAELVLAAGIRWVGPPPSAIRTMGDKAAARRLAESLGVPVVAGYDGPDQSERALTDAAAGIGLPLIVKPSAGGGGKGMRVVRDAATLRPALAAARREAEVAFGDDRLILERYLEGPRHVEIQVLFDGYGHGIHLGERDCSIQRRHQKVLEEAPSPGVDEALRRRLGEAALTLAGAVGYVGAGTCEFLVDDQGRPSFLEMNTRLQVEHPVTEMITGRDLVADQLRIAAGEALTMDQADVDRTRATGGHAIEVRLYAEDPDSGFLPATGTVELLRWPSGDGVRVDAGIEPGSVIGGRFDPMLAKVIAHGSDRAEALVRLTRALDATVVLGLTTNLRFLRWLVRQPAVTAGTARVDTIARIWPPAGTSAPVGPAESPAPEPGPATPPDLAWSTAADLLAGSVVDGGWRLNARSRIRLATEDGSERTVEVTHRPAGTDQPDVSAAPETSAPAAVLDRAGVAHVDVGGRSVAFRIAPPPDVDRAVRAAGHHPGGSQGVDAPMPGAVLAVHVAVGDPVEPGDPLVTLEAMKMEHVVTAPGPGTVEEIAVRVGDQVRRGQPLAILG